MKKLWTFSDNDLMHLTLALISYMETTQKEGIPQCTDEEVKEYIAQSQALADRINEIRKSFRIDKEDENDITSPWMERDLALVTIKPKPGDELYTVAPWGPDRWIVVEKADPGRPVGEHFYTQSTHAHRKKRELNKAAREMNAIMAANGGALII